MGNTSVRADSRSAAADWLNVSVVTAGSFIMVTSEFLPVGLLTRIASDLHRTPGELGLMVTAPGFTAAFAAPLSLLLLRRFDRRNVLIALTVLIALADLMVALASGFATILLGRVLLGAAVGAFWSCSLDAARSLVSTSRGNMAVAIVLGGISLGTVVGVPIGAYLGDLIGWRMTFESAVAFAGVVAVIQMLALPSIGNPGAKSVLDIAAALQIPGLGFGFLAITSVVVGHFAGYTYLEAFVRQAAQPTPSQLSWVLAAYGVAGFVGTFLGERLIRASGRFAFTIVAAAMAASLLWSQTMPNAWIALLPPVILWGAAYGAVPVCSRLWLFEAAPDRSDIVSAFYVSGFQLALAAGAFTGGVIVDHVGIPATFSYGAAAVGFGEVIMLLASARTKVRPRHL